MGMSVFAETGVLVHLTALRPMFRSRRLAKAFATKLKRTASFERITINGRLVVRTLWEIHPIKDDRGSLLSRLEELETGCDLFEILTDCLLSLQQGQVGKYGETYFEPQNHVEIVRQAWNTYILWFNEAAQAKVPPISKFLTFGSGRLSGGSFVQYGTPYARFDTDAVFSMKLTHGGKSLQKLIGQRPEVSTWANAGW